MPKAGLHDFPEIIYANEYERTERRPESTSSLHILIEYEISIIKKHHERIANAICLYWGEGSCAEYLQQLILNSNEGATHTRIGFKPEVLSAMMNLAALHDVQNNQNENGQTSDR